MKNLLLLSALVLGANCVCALAIDIRINFTTSGTNPENGEWNNLLINANSPNLANNDGSASGVSLTVTDNFFAASGGGWGNDPATDFYGDDDWLQGWAARTYWQISTYNPNQTAAFELAGLDDDMIYRIDLVAGYGFSGLGTYSVNGDSRQWDSYNDGSLPQQWMVWTEITPVGGVISISIAAVNDVSPVNAMRITAIPEPATGTLLGGFAVFVLVMCRRLRRTVP